MAFGSFNEGGGGQPMADINTTPLVDVMLVLLVIFIITAPLLNQAVPVDLPKVNAQQLEQKPSVLNVALDGDGVLRLDGEVVDLAALEARAKAAVHAGPNTEMHLRADRATRYERVAEVMAAAQRGGLDRIAFVTEPPSGGSAHQIE